MHTMCVLVLSTTAHPRSREPVGVLKGPLPWDNCYHPTCYDCFVRARTEWRDYPDSPFVDPFLPLDEAFEEDSRYGELLRAGLDDDRILRILDGQEDAPTQTTLRRLIVKSAKHFWLRYQDLISLGKIVPLCPLCVSTTSYRTSWRYLIHRSYVEMWIFSKSTSISSPAANPF